jgi:hypothetical protein
MVIVASAPSDRFDAFRTEARGVIEDVQLRAR